MTNTSAVAKDSCEAALRLVGQEPDIGQALRPRARLQRGPLGTVADERHREIGVAAQPRGGVHERVEALGQARRSPNA